MPTFETIFVRTVHPVTTHPATILVAAFHFKEPHLDRLFQPCYLRQLTHHPGKRMKRNWLRSCLLFFCPLSLAHAAVQPENHSLFYNWSGYYVGALGGGVYSHFNMQTSTKPGPLLNDQATQLVNMAGKQNLYSSAFITGIEGGYNWQINHLLLGIESDLQSMSISSNTDSGAIPNPNNPFQQYVISSFANDNWLLTIRPRIGYAAGNWLVFATGGLGLTLLQSDFVFTKNTGKFESSRISKIEPGYTVGAGVETAVTDHISLKAEYRFLNFNGSNAYQMNNNVPAGQVFTSNASVNMNTLEIGINYHFNNKVSSLHYPNPFSTLFDGSLWQTAIGARLFLSSGADGSPQPLFGENESMLYSRLTFNNLTATSEEAFARADHQSGFFIKGFLGAGSITDGELNDEDFPAGGAYSNTISRAKGNLSYATLDFGYSFFNSPTTKVGPFIGYNYYAQNINVYGCQQLAGATICVPNYNLASVLGISEDDRYNSLRIGLSSELNITRQLAFSADVAYLPYINYNAQDIHLLRQLLAPERSNDGDGAMLETSLGYQFAPSWNAGIGARYWMWNAHSGQVHTYFQGDQETFQQATWYNSERYGVFFQLNYTNRKSLDTEYRSVYFTWPGLYTGVFLGGAWSNTQWRDPFSSTIATTTRTNVAGFGDKVQATGPLGGIDLHYYWQHSLLVYGIGGSLSIADLRGNNTLFSGIGGVNGQVVDNYLGTIVAKIGTPYESTLLYVNAGTAVLNTRYSINGNTGLDSLGAQNQTVTHWGWTAGVGIEYVLADHWTTTAEFDYINIPRNNISFAEIATINTQQMAVDQQMNLFKLGLSYKFT